VYGRAALNRADSDKSPKDKLNLDNDDDERRRLLKDSAIRTDQIKDWRDASGEDKPRSWGTNRALAFQRAVEERTFYLYQRYFEELGFAEWLQSAV
jgi:hypothetical protein